jgi:hypothetical protein
MCPVCGHPGLNKMPRTASGGSYQICHSCGFVAPARVNATLDYNAWSETDDLDLLNRLQD